MRGTGHLSNAHREQGLTVHPGFDLLDGACGDVLLPSTFAAIVGLICRRVVKVWHIAPVCTTFGTLRRPRLRSKLLPFGFDPLESHTALGNQFAMRGGFILWLCILYGLIASCEQPGGSVMYRLDIFQLLLCVGFNSIRFPFCNWGTPFQKMSWWIGNNPRLQSLADVCHCGRLGQHFQVRGSFDAHRLASFKRQCRPSCVEVFGRIPCIGDHVKKISAGYPLTLCSHVATLNKQLIHELVDQGSQEVLRPYSTPARWVGQLARSLSWKELLQYEFAKTNHINVNENLAYRSLLKHVSKCTPHSRFIALLDSRVAIGCNAKGRSSSKQLNFYLARRCLIFWVAIFILT